MRKPMNWRAEEFLGIRLRMKYCLIYFLLSLSFLGPIPAQACEPPAAHPQYLLVGNKGEDTVSFINLRTGFEVARENVSASAPHEIAITQDGRFAAVVNYGDAVIDIFDVSFKSIVSSIDLGENTRPHGLVALKTGGFVATTEGNESIVILTPDHDFSEFGYGPCPSYNWSVDSIKTGQKGTHMVALSPDERVAFTANMQSETISRINLITRDVQSVAAGKEVEGIAVTNDGSEVWASVRGEDKVLIYNANSLEKLTEIPVGDFPLRIVASPDGQKMATSNLMDGTVSVIDVQSRTVERSIQVSEAANARQVTLLFSDEAPSYYDGKTLYSGTRLYVAETGYNTVAEIDFESGNTLRRFGVGIQGDGLAIVPASIR